MNDRIRQLIRAADRRCSETRGVYDEILVELTVQECMAVARDAILRGSGVDPLTFGGTVTAVERIREHFGVGE